MATSFLKRFTTVLVFIYLLPILGAAEETAEVKNFREAERYYSSGLAQKDRYEKGRYLNYVITLYKRYLNSYPNSKNAPKARFHLGYARQTLGKITEAKNTYRTLIGRHQKGPFIGSAARQLAYLAYVEESWDEAAHYFDLAAQNLSQENLRHNALTKRAQSLMKLGRSEEIAAALRKIITTTKHPYRDWARFMLGYQHYEADQFEDTIRELSPLLSEATPSEFRSQALFYTGLSAAELGRDDLAEKHLTSILQMSVDHPSLSPEQKKHLATNQGKAQTSLMGLYSVKEDWETVVKLFEMGNFPVEAKLEGRRSLRAGNAYFSLGNYPLARSSYRRVDRALPNTDIAFHSSFKCLQCDYHLQHPKLPERVNIFFELYQKEFPNHHLLHAARFYQGESYFHSNLPEKAARAYNQVSITQLDPSYQPELLLKKGWSLSTTGQFDGASRTFGTFLAKYPESPRKVEALNKRGEAHLALGDLSAAQRDFQAVLLEEQTSDHTAFALQGSARVLREEKEYEKMISQYRKLLANFPSLPIHTIANANYWIGWGFYKKESYDEVPPYLRKARDLVPEFYTQQVGDLLILTAFKQRDKEALHIALQEIFQMAPAKSVPPNMLSWLGVQMYHDGQVETAADYLERATNTDYPKRTDLGVWRILAKAQNRSGRYEQAITTCQLLLRQKQEPRWNADSYLDLAEAQLNLGQLENSLKSAQKGLEIDASGSHVAGLHLVSAQIALQQEEWERALSSFQTTIAMVPDDPILQPLALYGASQAAQQMNDANLAGDFANRLKNNFPDFSPSTNRKDKAQK